MWAKLLKIMKEYLNTFWGPKAPSTNFFTIRSFWLPFFLVYVEPNMRAWIDPAVGATMGDKAWPSSVSFPFQLLVLCKEVRLPNFEWSSFLSIFEFRWSPFRLSVWNFLRSEMSPLNRSRDSLRFGESGLLLVWWRGVLTTAGTESSVHSPCTVQKKYERCVWSKEGFFQWNSG